MTIGERFAFPREGNLQYGMTLRDWFAGQAISLILDKLYDTQLLDNDEEVFKVTAHKSYELADAMLAERNKQNDVCS